MTGRGYEKRDGERGQVLATTVIAFVAICALVAVAADTGLFFDHRRRMQTGVDSAAMAGAEQLRRAASDTQIQSAAFNAAATNGFTNGVNGAQVAVNHPPTSGFYAGNDAFVEAVISQVRPTTFLGILGFQTATVSTRAVAGATAGPACIYPMAPTAASELTPTRGAKIGRAHV